MNGAANAERAQAIVADDLTGACDAGVHFLRTGWHIDVMLDPGQPLDVDGLCVVSTNTRSLSSHDAGRVVEQLGKRLVAAGRRVLYKKLDSTLHGNFGAEIDALLRLDLAGCALVCSAFPDMGRRLAGGELLMGSERKPIGRNLASLLQEQSGREVVRITVEELRSDASILAASIEAERVRGRLIFSFDAEDESDLARVVQLGQVLGAGALLCGSTGLARHLGRSLAAAESDAPHPVDQPPGCVMRRVAILGTHSHVTRGQVLWLVREHGARVETLGGLRHALEGSVDARPIVVQVDLGALTPTDLEAALQALRDHGPVFLMLSGGDTARRVCEAAGVRAVRLLGELETGFPHGRIMGGCLDGWPIATKAGGFGTQESLGRWLE